MEGRVESPEIPVISEKSRSLDLRTLRGKKSRASIGQESGVFKRRHRSPSDKNDESKFGQVKRRKDRKEVSLSSFETDDKKSKKGLDLKTVESKKFGFKLNGIAFFGKKSSKRSRSNEAVSKDQKVQNLSRLNDVSNDISCSLNDNVIVIPKRPRGFSGRKKFQANQVGKQVASSVTKRAISRPPHSSSKSGVDFSRSKLSGDLKVSVQSLVGKSKKIVDEFKESGHQGTSSISKFGGEDEDSVQFTDHRAPKRPRKNRTKRQKSEEEKQTHEDSKQLLVDNFVNIFEPDDDEENLEQNAARMLSSRFDPSCTGFSGRGVAVKSQSADGSLFSPLFDSALRNLSVDASEGSDTVSADTDGRVLRPRKQRKQKSFFRRQRRHFYEVSSRGLDPCWVVNKRIKVFWPLDQSWYFGVVKDYDPLTKLHHVKYDDRDEEWINLQNERFKLLLLPVEVPGKSAPENSRSEGKQRNGDGGVNFVDDNCIANFMDSEPIISWLSRSTHRLKSSSLAIVKKQKQSHAFKRFPSLTSSENSVATGKAHIDVVPSGEDINKLSIMSVEYNRTDVGEVTGRSLVGTTACSNDGKLPIVYTRKRFRDRQRLGAVSGDKSPCRSETASVVGKVRAVNEFAITLHSSSVKDVRFVDSTSSLICMRNFELLKFLRSSTESDQIILMFSLPPLRVSELVFGAKSFRIYSTLLSLEYGKVITVWPSVRLEMLFIDNILGLRFMLFEGCLKQAVAFICFVLAVIHQPIEYGQLGDLQLPVTSIRFKISGLPNLGGQLEFVFYNFMELEYSKWIHLDNRIKHHCIVTKELPLAECTYANIKIFQSGSDQIPVASISEVPVSLEGLQKRSRQSIMCRDSILSKFSGKLGRFPPLILSFSAAPTFFLSLHLNLLMENNVAPVSLQNHDPLALQVCPKSPDNLTVDDCSLVGDSLDHVNGLENMQCSLDSAATAIESSCPHSTVEAVLSADNGWSKSSPELLNGDVGLSGASVGCEVAGKSVSDVNVENGNGHGKGPCHTGPWRCIGKSCSSDPVGLSLPRKPENGCHSCFNGISIQPPPFGDVDSQPLNQGKQASRVSVNNLGTRNMIDGTIGSTNPTAPRSIWHRSRHGSVSSSFGHRSKLWPDFAGNSLVNGFRKPRSQVSYLLPFGGYNFGSKPRSHRRKGRPYKKLKNDNVRSSSDGSGSPRRYLESLSCDANVLVTEGDRGWRECGAQVVLGSIDHKDWRLLVKFAGATKYSHKAHQFLQPGTTNRYTHAMMWKGGKDWILEFPDRSQWILFKEMHEECYNRNIRAASVKNIPIPGVHLIEDSDDNTVEVPFIRTAKYFRLIGSEVDMAMDPSHVLYDMESDDEEWISKQRNSSDANEKLPDISEEMFERVMDMFEKIAYAQQCDDFTSDEIEHYMVGVGPMDVIKAIHEHWKQKRQKKGMPLIRQLQPALWERYQQQVKEWEVVVSKTHNLSDGCKEKVLPEKPPMFAFCLRPRGLEVPNKGTKQRSHRRFSVIGHHSGISRDPDGLQVIGKKLNGFTIGDEKAFITDQGHGSSDVLPWPQISSKLSPRDAAGSGILSMSSDWSERNQYKKLHRNKSKKVGMHFSRDSQMVSMSYNQRSMGRRNGVSQWNSGLLEWHSPKHYPQDGFQRHRADQFSGPDVEEFRLRDASGAAQHALNMAKLKRERAHRLLHKADLALHKAVSALMIAEAIKESEKELIGDG